MKSPTMTDVAERAGVSHATVSRIINGRPGVSAKAEAKVREAISELQYLAPPSEHRPGRSAAKPDQKLRGHVALLTFDRALSEHSAFVASIYEGARRAARERGISISLLSLDDCDTVPDWISPTNLDGLLLHGLRSRGHLTRSALEIPSLWLTTHEDGETDQVLPGNEAVGRLAAEYLHSNGHQVVTALSIDDTNPSYAVRVNAFQSAARSLGMKCLKAKKTKHSSDEQKMTQLIEGIASLEKTNQPTGLFIPSDYMTALAHAELRRKKLKPGGRFDIISCDNEKAYLDGLYPRPATIDLGTEARGRLAFEMLLARIQDPARERKATLLLEPVLVPSPDA
ncbi:LacI family transcriptional regulator [Verrucomicrobiales bacterium]|nr:LacI family transcriptional regulator [Verrucomicrobiales bacterium]